SVCIRMVCLVVSTGASASLPGRATRVCSSGAPGAAAEASASALSALGASGPQAASAINGMSNRVERSSNIGEFLRGAKRGAGNYQILRRGTRAGAWKWEPRRRALHHQGAAAKGKAQSTYGVFNVEWELVPLASDSTKAM